MLLAASPTSEGDVEVVVVDEDNIRAGDPPVQLSPHWEVLARSSLDLSDERFVSIAREWKINGLGLLLSALKPKPQH